MTRITETGQPARVVVASSDVELVSALESVLAPGPDLELMAVEADAPAAVSAARKHRAALCVVDDSLDGGSLALTAELTARLPEVKVIVLAAELRSNALRAHVRAGAAGYLPRTMNLQRLPDVALAVLAGSAAIPRAWTSSLIAEFRDSAPRRRPVAETDLDGALTGREWEIFDLLREGLATREIAARLYVSTVTVRSHVASILRKLGLPDRTALSRVEERLGGAQARDRSLARAP